VTRGRDAADLVDEVRRAVAALPDTPGHYDVHGEEWRATAVVAEASTARLADAQKAEEAA